MKFKTVVRRTPVIGPLATRIVARRQWDSFDDSHRYWTQRYEQGGNSGAGSYGWSADYKAEILNAFVAQHEVASVLEWGCGDGNQLALAEYPRYLGLDLSDEAVGRCVEAFREDSTKSFMSFHTVADRAGFLNAELALSLDVIYHLVEDSVFDEYMQRLFHSATRFVIVYATDLDIPQRAPHVLHRKFSDWVESQGNDWILRESIVRPKKVDDEEPDFFVFERA